MLYDLYLQIKDSLPYGGGIPVAELHQKSLQNGCTIEVVATGISLITYNLGDTKLEG